MNIEEIINKQIDACKRTYEGIATGDMELVLSAISNNIKITGMVIEIVFIKISGRSELIKLLKKLISENVGAEDNKFNGIKEYCDIYDQCAKEIVNLEKE